ncbi:MAG: class I SAM-dependent methyltransferase [Thermomicrobiales bacterium]
MRVLDGKKETSLSRAELQARMSGYDGTDIDIGTGDGRYVLDRAARHSERFIIGLDPVAGAMEQSANRITRPRTRLDNALFVIASVEQMPEELAGICDQIFINLPWGSLMRGLILGEPAILEPLAFIGRRGAIYRIILNLRIFSDPVPLEVQGLPEVTGEYVRKELRDRYARAGLDITGAGTVPADTLNDMSTTWARRLSHQRPPPSFQIIARRI